MTVLHEPFSNLRDYGETDVGARTFDSPVSLLAWLRDETRNVSVFLKDTTDHHCAKCRPLSTMPGGTLRWSSTPMTLWPDPKRRWRRTARASGRTRRGPGYAYSMASARI
jgi:hypothetical protein